MQENQQENSDIQKDDVLQTQNLVADNDTTDDAKQNTDEYSKPKIIEIAAGNTLFGYFLGAMIIFGVCFVCSIFLFQIIFKPINVIGSSMLPTINRSAKGTNYNLNTDTVYYVKARNYKDKDIVVIKEGKTDSGNKIIKRIVALPGQKITFRFVNYVFDDYGQKLMVVEYLVDDVLMQDDYTLETKMQINTKHETSALYQFHNELVDALQNPITYGDNVAHEYSLTLGEDEYFVMGDNRNNSVDSRMFGAVKYDEIAGSVVIHVKYGQTLIRAIWHAMFGNCLPFGVIFTKI
ncbi:MAG: signal peptidase I [Clostridia bacterium]|nr:signal peptidase I [Clostridia bacterium]